MCQEYQCKKFILIIFWENTLNKKCRWLQMYKKFNYEVPWNSRVSGLTTAQLVGTVRAWVKDWLPKNRMITSYLSDQNMCICHFPNFPVFWRDPLERIDIAICFCTVIQRHRHKHPDIWELQMRYQLAHKLENFCMKLTPSHTEGVLTSWAIWGWVRK